MADAPGKRPETHLEIHALQEGGYVVREGRFNNREDGEDPRWIPRWERAAFSTLKEAVGWLEAEMINKAPTIKSKPSSTD